jgi:hypothetical protein
MTKLLQWQQKSKDIARKITFCGSREKSLLSFWHKTAFAD